MILNGVDVLSMSFLVFFWFFFFEDLLRMNGMGGAARERERILKQTPPLH